jgi:2-oxoglutarate ferredoxin oxidoreductase subunit alpha
MEPGAKIGLIAYGTSDYAVEEARAVLTREGVSTHYLRVRSFPLSPEIRDFVNACDRVYVIDQNRDAQMRQLLRLDFPDLAMKFESITHYTGLPLGAQFLTRAILDAEKGK